MGMIGRPILALFVVLGCALAANDADLHIVELDRCLDLLADFESGGGFEFNPGWHESTPRRRSLLSFQEVRQTVGNSSSALPCDPATQRLGLLMLFNNTNGAAWTNATGWPPPISSSTPSALANFSTSVPTTTGACLSSGVVLPDHCCWHGVQCCTPQTCSSQQTSICSACSCTQGLITSIDLQTNNVSSVFLDCNLFIDLETNNVSSVVFLAIYFPCSLFICHIQ